MVSKTHDAQVVVPRTPGNAHRLSSLPTPDMLDNERVMQTYVTMDPLEAPETVAVGLGADTRYTSTRSLVGDRTREPQSRTLLGALLSSRAL